MHFSRLAIKNTSSILEHRFNVIPVSVRHHVRKSSQRNPLRSQCIYVRHATRLLHLGDT